MIKNDKMTTDQARRALPGSLVSSVYLAHKAEADYVWDLWTTLVAYVGRAEAWKQLEMTVGAHESQVASPLAEAHRIIERAKKHHDDGTLPSQERP